MIGANDAEKAQGVEKYLSAYVEVYPLHFQDRNIAEDAINRFTLLRESKTGEDLIFASPPKKQSRQMLRKFLLNRCDFKVCGVEETYDPVRDSYGQYLVVMIDPKTPWPCSGQNYLIRRDNIYGGVVALPYYRAQRCHYVVSRSEQILFFPITEEKLRAVGGLQAFKDLGRRETQKHRRNNGGTSRRISPCQSVSPRTITLS